MMDLNCECSGDVYHPYVERHYTARKQHRCDDCGGIITKGEGYRLQGGRYDDKWEWYKQCADCTFIIAEVGRTLLQHCGGWTCVDFGDLELSWESLFEDVWSASEQEIEQIRRLVGMQNAACKARSGDGLWLLPNCALDYKDC